jgi:chitinase
VSWFNIMSYDLHGMWDYGNKWTGPHLNAHTNLTEISDALDLIWRNDIKPDMVVLGLGFYGRAFRATSQSCLEPGCMFQERPAEAGNCSNEAGILLNSEIDQIVKDRNIKPKLYKDAAVKVASWANQWVAYDDEETLGIKSAFAQSHCLGGLMVWAVSHDTADFKYTKALAKVSNRRAGAQAMGSDQTPVQVISVPIPQCKWMGCGEACPAGWIHMKRTDTDRKSNDDYMVMNMGCEDVGGGTHPLCCPPDAPLPQCGWYSHHNGACQPGCPSGMIEIGSTNAACRHGYQSACCSTGTKSTQLYTTCEWGPWPGCDDLKQCPWKDGSKNTQLVVTPAGTGGAWCDERGDGRQKRKLCCDTRDAKKTFKNCKWHQEILENDELYKFGISTCKPTCPLDLVLVAQDWGDENFRDPNNPKCGAGMRAHCCEAAYSFDKTVENPVLDEYRSSALRWLEDATCPNPGNGIEFPIARRAAADTPIYYHRIETLLLALLVRTETPVMLDALARVWDSTVGERYPFLRIDRLRPYAESLPSWMATGPIDVSHKFLCLPDYWNERSAYFWRAGGTDAIVCGNARCPSDGTPDDHYICLADLDDDDSFFRVQDRGLERRGKARKFVANFVDTNTGQSYAVTVTLSSVRFTLPIMTASPLLTRSHTDAPPSILVRDPPS